MEIGRHTLCLCGYDVGACGGVCKGVDSIV